MADAPTQWLSSSDTLEREPLLRQGSELAGRYQIIRYIGRGGMGEVYEAEDSLLCQRVALKLLLGGAPQGTAAVERFRREVHLARQVSHRNVCRVFDIGCHRQSGEASPHEIYFLTMELLEGETLFERIRRDGPFGEAEAAPIIHQIADGLAAAHAQGVLHRDLKTANVFLVRSPSARAVVTDFGLAKLLDDHAADRPSSGFIAGTPEYMSPEQLKGSDLTAASDIYSFGVVLYEMLTGSVPFSAASPIAAAVKSLAERPPSPKLLAPALSPRWEAAVLRCLDQDPGKRFVSPLDIAAALDSASFLPSLDVPPRKRRGLLWITMAAVLVLLSAALALQLWTHRARSPSAKSATETTAPRRVIALFGFKNLSGNPEAAWISTALGETLFNELSASRLIRCLPGETTVQIRRDLHLPDSDSFSPETLRRVRAASGTDVVISGSYLASQARLRVDIHLQDATSGETLQIVTVEGEDVLDLVSDAGARLRGALGLPALGDSESRAATASLPQQPATAQLYAEGLDRLRTFDPLGARERLQKAVEAEPTYPLSHLALSDTWLALGYMRSAEEEARKAFDLARGLTPADRLTIEGRYRERARDWSRAIQAYQTLWREFPDSVEDGLRLAFAQVQAGRETEALKTVEEMRRLPRPISEDPRISLAEAAACASSGDWQRQYDASHRAADAARSLGAQGSLAEALLSQGEALLSLGRPGNALDCFGDARKIFSELHNPTGELAAILSTAEARREAGAFAEARQLYGEARKVFREKGDRRGEAWALSQKAVALRLEEDLGAAQEAFEEALLIAEDAGNDPAAAAILNNLAVVEWLRGDRDGSRHRIDAALVLCRRAKDVPGECRTVGNYAFMLMQDGELATAARLCADATRAVEGQRDDGLLADCLLRQGTCSRLRGEIDLARNAVQKSLEISRARVARAMLASALEEMSRIERERGDPVAARRCAEEAVLICQEVREVQGSLRCGLLLAVLDLDAGKAASAETAARDTMRRVSDRRPENVGAEAAGLLVRVLLARGDVMGAEEAAQQAVSRLARGASLEVRVAVTLSMALARARAGNPAQARAILAPARADTSRAGMRVAELDARLVEAQIEMLAGRKDLAGAISLEVKDAASAGGLLRLMRQAASILEGSQRASE